MTAVSKKAFAQLYGCGKPYVSQLVKTGRLVLTANGLVDVEQSFELLGVTSDPSKAGVRERWAAYRAGSEGAGTAITAAALPVALPVAAALGEAGQLTLDEQPAAAPSPAPSEPPRSSAYHDARTEREQAQASMARLDLNKALGKVLEAEPTLKAVMDAHLAARSEIMKMPARLAQLVAVQKDPSVCFGLIEAECERACQRMVEAARGLSIAQQLAAASAAAPSVTAPRPALQPDEVSA
ncbi:MAG: hypothetical protein EOP35_20405 [Rubrivivax sp.]|nr:MAG: hypothetical protein EOP35_20405 [Rubrivivax sp.]